MPTQELQRLNRLFAGIFGDYFTQFLALQLRLLHGSSIEHIRMSASDFKVVLEQAIQLCDDYLANCLPAADIPPKRLHQAMRHAVFAGGKRLRPALILASCRCFGGKDTDCTAMMAAVEMLHTYTLVHDDLPAMDDDVLRRGKPTIHVAFDEATAILCGDALLTLAMGTIATHSAEAVRMLADACGSLGVVGGQQDDLDATASDLDQSSNELMMRIHTRKTAALLSVSCALGALAANAEQSAIDACAQFGHHIGLAFQITDDVLDATANSNDLGKTAGKDQDQDKLTSVRCFGLEQAKRMAAEQVSAAHDAIAGFGENGTILRQFADFILVRTS